MTTQKNLHIDEWLDQEVINNRDVYPHFMFTHWRRPAFYQGQLREVMKDCKLFCTYSGKVHRITGASRMGDIYLTPDLEQECGYEIRDFINHVTDLRKQP